MTCTVCDAEWAEFRKALDAAAAERRKAVDAALGEFETVHDAAWAKFEKVSGEHPHHNQDERVRTSEDGEQS